MFELGLIWAGLGHVVWQVERDPWCRQVLARHWPGVPRVGNVRLFGRDRWGSRTVKWSDVDLICGGFPCQDISSAGKGEGLSGARSGLWFEFARIVSEFEPKWVVVENVASGAKRWVDAVVSDLGQRGYEVLPVPIAAEDVGAPHRRQRIFLVARRVPDAVSGQVRHGQQWGPARRPRGVCDRWARLAGLVGEEVEFAEGVGPDSRWIEHEERGSEQRRRQESGRGREEVVYTDQHGAQGGALGQPGVEQLPQGRQAHDADGLLAHDHGHGLEEVGLRGALEGGAGVGFDDLPPYGYDAHGRCGPRPWPPGPGDLAGWEDWLAAGGPEPALRRRADGLPCGMARREWERQLKATGNAIVPQCVEVVGYVIRELAGF